MLAKVVNGNAGILIERSAMGFSRANSLLQGQGRGIHNPIASTVLGLIQRLVGL